jgi:uncharacterized protein involved in outer membrane biogenesis
VRKVLIILAVIAVVIVVGVYLLLANLNSLVAKVIEKEGSKVTQTSVTVSGVDIALREGRASIKGLRVANPEGFGAGDAFSLDDITVGIDIKSARENPIVIDEIRIQAPVVYAEVTKTGSSNIDELRKRAQASPAGSTGKRSEASGQAKRIRIKQFVLEKGKIDVDASALGIAKQTIALPEMRLSDVGGAGGAPPDEIAKVIMTALAQKAASEIAASEVNRAIEGRLGGSLKGDAKGLLEKIVK